jgi:hypothetical protein
MPYSATFLWFASGALGSNNGSDLNSAWWREGGFYQDDEWHFKGTNILIAKHLHEQSAAADISNTRKSLF